MSRGRVTDSLLAGLASLVVAWPLTTLFTPNTWIRPTLGIVLMVVVAGIVGRRLTTSWVGVIGVQLVGVVLAAGWIHGRGHLWHGLPTLDMVLAFNNLLVQARETVQNYAAPAPTNRGITLGIGLAIGVAAIVVDHLAVMRRSPALAGLPLLTAYLISASNSGSSLHPMYFVAAAAVWLLLLGRQGIASLRRWGTVVPMSTAGRRSSDDREGVYGYAAVGRSLAAAGLVAAVVLPVAIPHLPTRYLIDGLGRSENATGFSDGQVGLRSTLDLARSLESPTKTPVFTYTTNAPQLTPLRVGVLEDYVNDTWRPDRPDVSFSRRTEVPPPEDLGDDVPRETYRISVNDSRLEAPQIAAPTPVVGGDLGRIEWGLDEDTGVVAARRSAKSYSFSYLALNPTTQQLNQPVVELKGGVVPDDLQVDQASRELVEDLTREVVPKGATRIEAARAIQKYLRSDGGFSYSLDLPETYKDEFGRIQRPGDALTLFLKAKVGYCVQFATAMVMMSRAAGIPARMAIGFLPGAASRGTYTVTQAEAHAWPELYFDGIGWLRFEPTPAGAQTTVAPPYSVEQTAGGSDTPATNTAGGTASSVSRPPDGRNDPGATDPSTSTSTSSGIGSWLGDRRTTIVLWVLLGLVAGLLGALAVPLAARARRRRRLKQAADEAARVEAEWQSMVERLGDLGVILPRGSTPRQAGRFYQREAYLEGDESTALQRVVEGVERARYMRPGSTDISDVRGDVATVVRAVSAVRRRKDRLHAAWWPTEGVVEWRERSDAVMRVLRRPADRFREWRERRTQ